MATWRLSNIFNSVDYQQFHDDMVWFKTAVEEAFGTECKLSIEALNAPKEVYQGMIFDGYPGEYEENLRWVANQNEKKVFLKTGRLESVTPDVWDHARYIEATFTPVDESKAPEGARARIEFKGLLPRQVTFHVKPDVLGDGIRKSVSPLVRFFSERDGSKTNSNFDAGFGNPIGNLVARFDLG